MISLLLFATLFIHSSLTNSTNYNNTVAPRMYVAYIQYYTHGWVACRSSSVWQSVVLFSFPTAFLWRSVHKRPINKGGHGHEGQRCHKMVFEFQGNFNQVACRLTMVYPLIFGGNRCGHLGACLLTLCSLTFLTAIWPQSSISIYAIRCK